MADRYCALTVVLETDMHEDDAQALIDAIKQLRGVLDAVPHVVNIEIHAATTRARHEMRELVWDAIGKVRNDRR